MSPSLIRCLLAVLALLYLIGYMALRKAPVKGI